MAKKKSTLINMLVALFVITAVSGGILGLVYGITKDAIAKVEQDKNDEAISKVFPLKNATYEPDTLKYIENGTTVSFPCTIVKDSTGTIQGMAIKTSEGGFGGKIELMVGISVDGKITGTSVLSHSETPGLGANMTGKFKDQFDGKDPTTFTLKVKKDGGDVDAITAATITSRAYTKAIEKAFQAYAAFIDTDEGIHRRLLPQSGDTVRELIIDEKNIMHVFLDNNELLINGLPSDLSTLKDEVKHFMTPRPDDESAPEVELKEIKGLEGPVMVSKGIISLQCNPNTSYDKYIIVQDVLSKAFYELRDEMALKHFGQKYKDLNESQVNAINDAVPVRVSDAEPDSMNDTKGGTENE